MKCCLNLPAPAKLNLFLHVIGRKPDGMHLLESVFSMIDLCDYLDFEVLDEPKSRSERTFLTEPVWAEVPPTQPPV